MIHTNREWTHSPHSDLNFSGEYYNQHVDRQHAALAQLVEHPHGKGKVMGSCPIGGSIIHKYQKNALEC